MSGSHAAVDLGWDPSPLGDWVRDRGLPIRPPLRIEPLGDGKSNLTYRVTGADGARLVLRRPPLGPLLPTAHDVLREARIIDALGGTGVPVPEVLAIADETVIGAPFVIFELVDGHVIRHSAAAAGATAAIRRGAGPSLVDALARTHALEPAELGLADLVRPGAYVERQLRRWKRQWDQTAVVDTPLMDEVHSALVASAPDEQRSSLVHSDAKLDNVILDDDGRVVALLDWELAAIGDPLADLGLLLAYWAEEGDEMTALQDPPTLVSGFSTRTELVETYQEVSDLDIAAIDFHLAFSYWKIAAIVAGVASRRRGDQSVGGDVIERFEAQVRRLAEMAARTLAGVS